MPLSTPTQPAGSDTEDELQAHLAELEALAMADDKATAQRSRPFDDVQADLYALRLEIEHLRGRLHVITAQAETVVKSRVEWADASAHAQLGQYPWLKLAGAMAGTFIATRLIRSLPLGPLLTAALPLVAASVQGKIEK
ncbi:hypothetical protein [Rhizobium sp. BK176]|uniref:hypothetical protein n=1 Tax=Rhizobium sp. BK176 TaxID=2587071 RepID=UPI00216A3BCB|nr:hypothetical protein [Rhizobium sp. BK176]MCS4096669.1 hypothetical protein [Rhizobium sp. BK176]